MAVNCSGGSGPSSSANIKPYSTCIHYHKETKQDLYFLYIFKSSPMLNKAIISVKRVSEE